MQENMKSNTTLCILSGIFEVIKGCDFAYKADFNPEYEAVKIKKHKIWFSKVKYKIPGLNFYSHPFFHSFYGLLGLLQVMILLECGIIHLNYIYISRKKEK